MGTIELKPDTQNPEIKANKLPEIRKTMLDFAE
jgi:hypothetical protein